MIKWHDIALFMTLGSVIGGGISYSVMHHKRTAKVQYQTVQEDWNNAVAEGRAKVVDLNSDGTDEVVYFPLMKETNGTDARTYVGAPKVFTQAGDSYTEKNPFNDEVMRDAVRLGDILEKNSGDPRRLEEVMQEFEKVIPANMKPLVMGAVLDPSMGLVDKDKLPAAYAAAMPFLAKAYQMENTANLLDPKTLFVTFGTHFIDYLVHPENAKPMTYTNWTKSGPGWENVGRVSQSDEATDMVKVAPGSYVHPNDKVAIKQYDELRKDPNVSWAGGFIRNEHPVGMTRQEYDNQTERHASESRAQEARMNQANERRRQFEQNMGQQAQQIQQGVNQAGQAINNFLRGLQKSQNQNHNRR